MRINHFMHIKILIANSILTSIRGAFSKLFQWKETFYIRKILQTDYRTFRNYFLLMNKISLIHKKNNTNYVQLKIKMKHDLCFEY